MAKTYAQIADLSSSVALPSIPAGCRRATIQALTQAVRYRPDGATTAPTSSSGMVAEAGTQIVLQGNLGAYRFIEAAASAELNIEYDTGAGA